MSVAFTSQEPVIIDDAVFMVERHLPRSGEMRARVGDVVGPETVIAESSLSSGRPVTVQIARELGVPSEEVSRYLARPVGSTFKTGEVIARARRGLRTSTVVAPVNGALTCVNETGGTGTLEPEAQQQEFQALVYGEVVASAGDRGVVIRSGGAKIRGAIAFGSDAWGPLAVAVDRPDRELTADAVTADLSGAVVVAGMTVGATALRRLASVGARAVIVGSVAEGEVRRLVQAADEPTDAAFWGIPSVGADLALDLSKVPVTIFVTEGFGRRAMTAPVFDFLMEREGRTATVLLPPRDWSERGWPDLYLTAPGAEGEDTIQRVEPADGVLARLVDPQHLGILVTCRSGVQVDRSRDGVPRAVVEVELSNRTRRLVPLANLELLRAR